MASTLATVALPGDDELNVRVLEKRPVSEREDASTVVVLAHPFLPLQQLEPLAGLLSGERRVVGVDVNDLIGAPADWRRASASLLDVLDELAIERYHLVGVYLGGLLAQQHTVERPAGEGARLRSTTLVSTHTGGEHEVPPYPQSVERLASGLVDGARPDLRHAALVELIHDSTLRRRPGVVDSLEELSAARGLSTEELEAWRRAATSFGVFDSFPGIEQPVLVLHGEFDRITPPENARVLERQIPGAERVKVTDSGHLFYLEDPGTVFAALQTFFERVETFVP